MTVTVDVCKYAKFLRDWKLSGNVKISGFMIESGLTSTVYDVPGDRWSLSEEDYTMFVLRWG